VDLRTNSNYFSLQH